MKKWIIFLAFVKIAVGQGPTTEDPWGTVTYNPGEECLPYDGSIVPDCSKYVDPVTKQPYYKEHSSNCSRFWECGPNGETCLVECAHCGGSSNPQCEDRWALTFDPSKQYPIGPVCVWPVDLDCGESLVCDIDKPEYECCENQDCCACPGSCYCAFNGDESASNCVQESPCNCENNSDCLNFDGTCNVPPPHDTSCTYCESNECKPGCIDNDNCPDDYVCNSDHVCENGGGVCSVDPDCNGYDEVCNAAHDNCFFCGDDSDCASETGCCPGCHDSDLNCAYPTPICNQDTHLCGCTSDADCNAPDICDTDNNMCVAPSPCVEDNECDGFDAVCNVAYDNCFYCGSNSTADCGGNGCCEGCGSDTNCPYPTPVCQDDHKCGCNTDADCNAGDFCNTDTNKCEAQCKEDNECDGSDEICNEVYDNCFYCGAPSDCDDFGCCPGCGSNANCLYPKPICQNDHHCGCNTNDDCEVGDVCNTESNKCEHKEGFNLLNLMVFTSAGCDGCTTEGVNMLLTGSTSLEQPPECETVNLDHPATPDYVSTGTFKAVPEEVDAGWDTCYRSALEGEISNAMVTWTGEGTWSPTSICFGWTRPGWKTYICDFPASTTLANGESATLMCKQGDSATC